MSYRQFIDKLIAEVDPPLPHSIDPGCTITHYIERHYEEADLLEAGADYFFDRINRLYPWPEYAVGRKARPDSSEGFIVEFIINRE